MLLLGVVVVVEGAGLEAAVIKHWYKDIMDINCTIVLVAEVVVITIITIMKIKNK